MRYTAFALVATVANLATHRAVKFSFYTTMGLFTRAIFWGTETTFWFICQTEIMCGLGAILGLAVGYVVNYNLDRRFVFTNRRLTVSA